MQITNNVSTPCFIVNSFSDSSVNKDSAASESAAIINQPTSAITKRFFLKNNQFSLVASQQNTPAVDAVLTPTSRDLTPASRDLTPASRDLTPASRDLTPPVKDIIPVSGNIASNAS